MAVCEIVQASAPRDENYRFLKQGKTRSRPALGNKLQVSA